MSIRYSVLGAGAMGSAFGARLCLHGYAVELLNRSVAHSAAIKRNGLQATLDGESYTLDIAATTVTQASPADVVILFTKSHQIENALHNLPDALRKAHIVTLQNGLSNGVRVAAQVGEAQTIEGVSMMPAEFIAPGVIASSDAAQTWMYHASGQPSELVEQIGADFNHSGITTTVTSDVQSYIWQKACFNVAMNALCGITNGSPGLLQQFPDGNALAHELADEALSIAQVQGVVVNAEKVHELINYACANHTRHKPSMLQDLENERLTEVEALNGYIVAQAEQQGVAVPLNRMILRLLRLREQAPAFWRRAVG